MKNHISLALVGMICVFITLGCNITINGDEWGESIRGSGSVVEETRNLNNVSSVLLAMEGTLHIAMSGSESFSIEAEDNLLDYIQTDVRAGKLVIETRQGIDLQTTRAINYYLTVDELKSIEISSSGNVETGDIQSESFVVKISSSGNLSISNLNCTSLRVEITSSGNLEISGGQVKEQDITISSSGEYRAGDLASDEAEVSLTSSGEVTIRVSDHLSGRLSSSGNIYYIGTPEVDVRTTSSGRTVQINE